MPDTSLQGKRCWERQAADSQKRGCRVKTLWPGSRGNPREVPFATSWTHVHQFTDLRLFLPHFLLRFSVAWVRNTRKAPEQQERKEELPHRRRPSP